MSKKRAVKRAAERRQEKEDEGRVIVTTSRGIRGECMAIGHAVAQLQESIRDDTDWPEAPTYTVKYAGGEEKNVAHDEKSIEDPKTTDEERAAWAEYLEALGAAETEFNDRFAKAQMRLFASDGFVPLNAPPEDEWIKKQEWIGYVVPEDPNERRLHYFLSEIIGNVDDDMMAIYMGIASATGADEGRLSTLEASFRSEMGESEGQDGGAGEGDTSGEPEAGLVEQSSAPVGEGAGEPGPDA